MNKKLKDAIDALNNVEEADLNENEVILCKVLKVENLDDEGLTVAQPFTFIAGNSSHIALGVAGMIAETFRDGGYEDFDAFFSALKMATLATLPQLGGSQTPSEMN